MGRGAWPLGRVDPAFTPAAHARRSRPPLTPDVNDAQLWLHGAGVGADLELDNAAAGGARRVARVDCRVAKTPPIKRIDGDIVRCLNPRRLSPSSNPSFVARVAGHAAAAADGPRRWRGGPRHSRVADGLRSGRRLLGAATARTDALPQRSRRHGDGPSPLLLAARRLGLVIDCTERSSLGYVTLCSCCMFVRAYVNLVHPAFRVTRGLCECGTLRANPRHVAVSTCEREALLGQDWC